MEPETVGLRCLSCSATGMMWVAIIPATPPVSFINARVSDAPPRALVEKRRVACNVCHGSGWVEVTVQ